MITFLDPPARIPYLEADDICREEYQRSDGVCQRCLAGWLLWVFPEANPDGTAAYDSLAASLRNSQLQPLGCLDGGVELYNDDPRNSVESLAAVWNTTAKEKWGYTVLSEDGKWLSRPETAPCALAP